MIQIHQLTFGPFSENTYLISDSNGSAIVIDPGMYSPEENTRFSEYVSSHKLRLSRMILTHAHLDHVFGVNWVYDNYGLSPEVHHDDKVIYDSAVQVATQYGLQMKPLIAPVVGLEADSSFEFGEKIFNVFHVPGHSPGSVCFYCKSEDILIAGDIIFQGSIGRTDLPGGDFDTLINSLKSVVLTLPDEVTIYSGHGPITNVGQERISNPFLIA